MISRQQFIEKIETPNPYSQAFIPYWSEQKKRCIEGFWVSGKWLPGPVYFYIHFWKIQLLKGREATSQNMSPPELRDLEWEKGYIYTEARGFSGFKEDEEITCQREVGEYLKDPINYIGVINEKKFPESYHNGVLKKYVPAREYLRCLHKKNLGRPLFGNFAKNVIDIEGRGSGKSYFAAGAMIAHNFLFSGATSYGTYLAMKKEGTPLASETVVGAIDTKYSSDLLSKVKLGLEHLVGSITINGEYFPSPLWKNWKGTFKSGQFIENRIDFKTPSGNWKVVGDLSKIHHRSYRDNSEAGSGTRPNLVCLEEVGFMGNLVEAMGSLRNCTSTNGIQFGTTWAFGTGGQMESGASEAAKQVFESPDAFDCLMFKDTWENRSNPIGLFIPATYSLGEYRDEEGNIELEPALKYLEDVRKTKAQAKTKSLLNKELQNNPLVPSEAFLVTEGNIFPVAELKQHLGFLESTTDDRVNGVNGELVFNNNGQVEFIPDLKNRLKPCDYPMHEKEDTTGCVQMWEPPQLTNGFIPNGLYVAGNDPYDQDVAPESVSLGSTFIYKRFMLGGTGVFNLPVAEYTARPDRVDTHHENVRKLLMLYNAQCLYENERNTLKMHFSHKHSLYLLAEQPTILKATENSSVHRGHGIHMTRQIKGEIELYLRDWLTESRGDGKLNLHYVYSKGLLKELISYNADGNFDRVIAFMLTILQTLVLHNHKVIEQRKNMVSDSFLERMKLGQFF